MKRRNATKKLIVMKRRNVTKEKPVAIWEEVVEVENITGEKCKEFKVK